MHEITGTKAQCINCGCVIRFADVEKAKKCTCKDMHVVKLSEVEIRISSGINNDDAIMTDYNYLK